MNEKSQSNLSFNPWQEIIQQYYDLFVILMLMAIFRPRIWPELFSVGLFNGDDEDE